MYEPAAITEDPWTGNPNPSPNLNPKPNFIPKPNPNTHPNLEVRWVVDGFNMSRKRHLRPGWGKTTPYLVTNRV